MRVRLTSPRFVLHLGRDALGLHLRNGLTGLVLLGGGANALAATVRCVNSADASCQSSHPTIQAAVTAASSGDIILVGPGGYNESVTIPAGKDGLALFGARAGVDARTDRGDPNKESIVNATGLGPQNAGFIVQAMAVVIDGFTVQGATDGTANGGGIDLKGGAQPAHGARILNNILQNNAVGLYLNFEGFAPVSHVLIEHNLFRNNNAGPQASSGDGIFTSACQNVTITENTFTGHKRLGIGINNSTDVTITHNESERDARFVVFTGTANSEFSHNHGKLFVASTFFSVSRATAVAVGFGNSYLTINDNVLEEGQAGSTIRGIQFGGYPGPNPANTNLTVSYNRIGRMPLSGIVAEAGMLTNSIILGNEIDHNQVNGISIGTGNSGNVLTQNVSKDNGGLDCADSSTGSGTLGTNNTWFHNVGKTSSPAGLCMKPARAAILVTGAGAGGGPHVRAFDAATGAGTLSFLAFDPGFTGGARVAVGDVNGDGVADIIVGTGPGGGPNVRIFDGVTGQPIAGPLGNIMAFGPGFPGGVFVAAGQCDGKARVIVGADAGGGPQVNVFDAATGAVIFSFFAYTPTFAGGVRVATGDVNGDGCDDIVTGAGPGGGPHVQVFSGRDLSVLFSFMAYDPSFAPGIYVAAGDVNGDGKADIVTGAGPGGGPHVRVFDAVTLMERQSFFAYDPAFSGGVFVGSSR